MRFLDVRFQFALSMLMPATHTFFCAKRTEIRDLSEQNHTSFSSLLDAIRNCRLYDDRDQIVLDYYAIKRCSN